MGRYMQRNCGGGSAACVPTSLGKVRPAVRCVHVVLNGDNTTLNGLVGAGGRYSGGGHRADFWHSVGTACCAELLKSWAAQVRWAPEASSRLWEAPKVCSAADRRPFATCGVPRWWYYPVRAWVQAPGCQTACVPGEVTAGNGSNKMCSLKSRGLCLFALSRPGRNR